MLPTSSFAAFVAFHNEFNTFAYAKALQSFTGGFNDDGRISRNLDSFLGYFTIRSCNDSGVAIVAQLDGRIPFTHVLINETEAQLAGFTEGQEVILEHVSHTVCNSVEIVPLSYRDFDVLDKNSGIVEEELLQQVTIVKKGMILPFWISPSVSALFRIGKIIPETDQPVILHNNSELHIAPISPSSLVSPSGSSRSCSAVSMEKVDELLGNVSGRQSFFRKERPVNLITRCLPHQSVEKDKDLSDLLEDHPSIVFTTYSGSYTVYDIVRLTSATDLSAKRFAVLARLPAASTTLEGFFHDAQNLLNEKLDSALCSMAWNLDYVRLHCMGISPKHFQELASVSVKIAAEKDKYPAQKIRSYLQSQVAIFPIVFGHEGIRYSFFLDGESVVVQLIPSPVDLGECQNSKETCFTVTSTTRIEFQEIKEMPESIHEKAASNYGSHRGNLHNFKFQDSLLEKCQELVKFHCFHTQMPAKVLVLGVSGSGKSSVLMRAAADLAHSSHCLFSSYIDCNSWKGKQAENIEKVLKVEMKKLEARRPALLLLDNLDFFQLQNEEEQRQIGIEKIFHVIRKFIVDAKLPILVTARKRTTLHKSLTTAGGVRLFNQILEIRPLDTTQRLDILRALIEPACDVSTAAKVTENFTVADLRKLAIRVQLEATIRGHSKPTEVDVQTALEHSRPAGHVVQPKKSERKWKLEDVGGMEKQKQLMTEVLLWPTKYAELYESCGIQLGRGVLLHGASGCGKTLLARAFADDSHFNVISVKGPELLSKYIGSSEENVRQVFERARASAPCILLFDELDSLAPRRGSDSTGVTDRVVNQLLTELDGAEGLQGVYVIGCTSRIDLIDPALIRPGRFDHIVECGLPTEEDRAAILKVVLKETAHSDVNLDGLAQRTANWTGADLKALVTNAKFEAARRRKGHTIGMEDIEAVFEESKPKERQTRKEKFRAGQRVTLA